MTEHEEAVRQIKASIELSVELAHLKPDCVMCLFTNAFDGHWSAVLTQTHPDQLDLAILGQEHESLAFLNGSFTETQQRRSVIEKKDFHII